MSTIPFGTNLPIKSIAILFLTLMSCNSSSKPEWDTKNKELIIEYGLKERELSDLPSTPITPNLRVTHPLNINILDSLEMYPGVMAKIFWTKGNLTSILKLKPNAAVPMEKMPADRFLMVTEGSIDLIAEGTKSVMMTKEREEPDGNHGGTPSVVLIIN